MIEERIARAEVDYTLTDRMNAAVERLEALADAIIRKLDGLQIDPDLEDGGDAEPSLGALDGAIWPVVLERESGPYSPAVRTGLTHPLDQSRWAGAPTTHVDLEAQCEDEGAACDDEGSDADSEPDDYHGVASYGLDQRVNLGSGVA